ncbi:MAG: hypothetical protein QW598_00815 [Pyrobaculum sp.]
MRVVVLVASAVLAGAVLDYVHVATMCMSCRFPSPMFPVFILLSLVSVGIFYLFFSLSGFKPAESPPRGWQRVIAQLLKEPERSIYLKVFEKGGEAQLSEVAKELGLRKLRAWRAAQRLAEKKLVYLEKRAGRLVVRLRPLEELSIEPENQQHHKGQKQHG